MQGVLFSGLLHHKGDKTNFSSRFGQGSIIGVHLDTWHGTLTFFKNRKCIGKSEGSCSSLQAQRQKWGSTAAVAELWRRLGCRRK